jgi:hypothetical protein
MRAGRPVSKIIVCRFCPPRLHWLPTGKAGVPLPHAATTVLVPSGSYLAIVA